MSLHVEWMKRFDKFRFHKLGEIRGYKYAAMKSIYLLCRSFFFLLLHNSSSMNLDHTFTYPESQLSDEKISHENIFQRRQKRRKATKKFSVTFRLMWRLYSYVFCCCFYLIFAERTNAATTELKRMKLYSNLMESFVCDISCVRKAIGKFCENLIKSLLNASAFARVCGERKFEWERNPSVSDAAVDHGNTHVKLPCETK